MRKIFRICLTGILLLSVRFPSLAADSLTPYFGEKSIQPSMTKESAEAVLGRVFGVQSERIDIDYHVFELMGHTPANAAVRSAFVPGWGQSFNGQTTKGVLFFSVFVAATIGSINRYNHSRNTYDDYRNAGVQDGSKYDDYKNQRNQAIILGGVAVGAWLLSVLDAHRHAYSPLWSEENSLRFAFAPHGESVEAEMTFQRRF